MFLFNCADDERHMQTHKLSLFYIVELLDYLLQQTIPCQNKPLTQMSPQFHQYDAVLSLKCF